MARVGLSEETCLSRVGNEAGDDLVSSAPGSKDSKPLISADVQGTARRLVPNVVCAVGEGPVPLDLAGHGKDLIPGVLGGFGKVESLEQCGLSGGAFPTYLLSAGPSSQQLVNFLVRTLACASLLPP